MNQLSLRRMVPLGAVVLAVALGIAGVTGGSHGPNEDTVRPRIAGGTESLETLLDRFQEALSAKDRGALDDLRVTEDEYRNVIVPGSVAEGEPPQVLSEEASEYFYGILHGKSSVHRDALLEQFGGHGLTRTEYSFEKGEKTYAGYKAYRRLVLELVDDEGATRTLQTGSIAEVDGRFKFISYIRD